MNDHERRGPGLDPAGGATPAETPIGEGQPIGVRIGIGLAVAAIAVGAGAGILAAAVTWGAAEAAVGVGAAFLVYASITGQTSNLPNLLAVRLIGGFRRASPGPAHPSGPTTE
jgi:hypothetical protein